MDGVQRIDMWLEAYAGAIIPDWCVTEKQNEDYQRYLRTVSRIALIAAVRRVREPAFKFDEMPVLISEEQGTSKSGTIRALCPREEWSNDRQFGLSVKETIVQTTGKWLVETSELQSRSSQIECTKAAMSRQADHARLAYGRRPVTRKRQFVPFGTSNKKRFLQDLTGNRRY